jgi:hypothetical protein
VVAELGVHAVLACPITAHGAAVGVLELYRHTPGPYALSAVESVRAIATALGPVILTELIPGSHVGRTAPPGRPAGKYRLARAHINVAVGMLSARLSVPIADAAAALRELDVHSVDRTRHRQPHNRSRLRHLITA